jgi:hypothetical protein
MIRCTTLATAACVAAVLRPRSPLNKCVVNGTVTYQQAACASTQPRKDPTLEELNAAQKLRVQKPLQRRRLRRGPAQRKPARTSGSSRFIATGGSTVRR